MLVTKNTLSLLLLLFNLIASPFEVFGAASPDTFFGGEGNNDGYLDWYDEVGDNHYSASTFLPSADNDPLNGVAIHWKIVGDYLELAVAARAKGWLAFGLAEAGAMEGADMVLYEDATPDILVDAYNLEARYPIDDECNDWELIDSRMTSDDFMVWEGRRLLDTKDGQDRPIIDDSNLDVAPHRVIAAWGDTPTRSYHDLNRARGSIRFFGEVDELALFAERMERDATGSFVIQAVDFPIKTQETDYVPFCVSKQDILDQGVPDMGTVNVIGFEAFVDEDTVPFVHHFTVRGSLETNNDQTECFAPEAQDTSSVSTQQSVADMVQQPQYLQGLYGWAPGESPLLLPEDVGSPLFGEEDMKSFQMVIHYNNPQLVSGIKDSSGVRFYYTVEPRKYALGTMGMADVGTRLRGELVGEGVVEHSFSCPSTCSQQALDEPITVIREYLHMHKIGTRAYTEQIRDGEVIRGGNVDYFKFDQQGNHVIQQEPYQMLPGDSFRTVCTYDSKGKNDTVFGLSSQEEMCISNYLYYPRKTMFNGQIPFMCTYGIPIPGCDVTHEMRSLESTDMLDLERVFGEPGEVCVVAPSDSDLDLDLGGDDTDADDSSAPSFITMRASVALLMLLGAVTFHF